MLGVLVEFFKVVKVYFCITACLRMSKGRTSDNVNDRNMDVNMSELIANIVLITLYLLFATWKSKYCSHNMPSRTITCLVDLLCVSTDVLNFFFWF